mmetsp:Transcript_9059/g.13587  ORF Transcript_9059/g.13587 Transcript_9059/m.13587 type:complete len:191 (+) Transcript_9059:22-594(+)
MRNVSSFVLKSAGGMADLPTLPKINALKTLEDFTKAVSVLFEPAPPLAEALFNEHKKSPFDGYKSVIEKAKGLIAVMDMKDKLQVINAHPRIGQKNTKKLSKFSKIEQGITDKKLTSEEEKVIEQFQKLNQDYEKLFGFKFIIFVNGRPKKDLLPIGAQRMKNTKEAELSTGIQAMLDIALDRLSKLNRV